MDNPHLPRSIHHAANVLIGSLLDKANEDRDVHDALTTLTAWLGSRLEPRRPHSNGHVPQKVVTPGPDRRVVPLRDSSPDRSQERLELVSKRARWKAEACRWSVERRRLDDDGADHADVVQQRDEELRQKRENLEDCFAWMLDSYRKLPDDERMEQIAACYDNLALAADCTLELIEAGGLEPTPSSDFLYPVAEAQSALLSALEAVDLRGDSDQRDLFDWLKAQTLKHRIYVDRHMKLDDPADFTMAEALGRRLQSVTDGLLDRKKANRQHDQLLSKIRYHLDKWVDAECDSAHDLESIQAAVAEWTKNGYSPDDENLRELIRELADHIPEDEALPADLKRTLEPPGKTAERVSNGSARRTKNQMVDRAIDIIHDWTVVLFAGKPRSQPKNALTRELELAEVRWTELDLEEAIECLDEELGAGDVDLVLVALRLPPVVYQAFKKRCGEEEIPLVWLPAGYGPGQVAHQVVRQVGRELV